MPRYLISTGMLPNTLMTRELAEAVEIFGLLYVHGSGMLDGLIPNKNLQSAALASAYVWYDVMWLPSNAR